MSAITMMDLKAVFSFPFKDEDWKQKFLVGALVVFAGMIIPVVPWVFIYGYAARVMRRIIAEKELPTLPAWDDWGELFVDGLKLLGAGLVYLAPFLVVMVLGWVLMFVPSMLMPFVGMASERGLALGMVVMIGGTFVGMVAFGVGMILAWVGGTFIPVVFAHVVATDSFKAAFRIKAWWAIFRANWGGFLISYVLIMGVAVLMMLAMQVLYLTVVLCCLLPFLLAPVGFYSLLLMSAFFAQAYAEGQESLAEAAAYRETD